MNMMQKRIFCFCLLTAMLCNGCSKKNEKGYLTETDKILTSELIIETETELETILVTDATIAEIDRTPLVPTDCVCDYSELLSADEVSALKNQASWITETYSLKVAAILTNNMNGMQVEEFAKDQYEQLFGTEPGFLFCINNESDKDYFYATKSASDIFSAEDLEALYAVITPLIVSENYNHAIQYYLERVELKLSAHADELEEILQREDTSEEEDHSDSTEGSEESEDIPYTKKETEHYTLCTQIITDHPSEELAESLYKSYFGEAQNIIFLIFDTENHMLYTYMGTEVSSLITGSAMGAILDRTEMALPDVEQAISTFMENLDKQIEMQNE